MTSFQNLLKLFPIYFKVNLFVYSFVKFLKVILNSFDCYFAHFQPTENLTKKFFIKSVSIVHKLYHIFISHLINFFRNSLKPILKIQEIDFEIMFSMIDCFTFFVNVDASISDPHLFILKYLSNIVIFLVNVIVFQINLSLLFSILKHFSKDLCFNF